jgi:hypothetical protein
MRIRKVRTGVASFLCTIKKGRRSDPCLDGELLLDVIDGLVRTGRNADAVQITFISIDDGNPLDNHDRIHRTDLDALTGRTTFILIDQKLHGIPSPFQMLQHAVVEL